jgi:hypothetical protein
MNYIDKFFKTINLAVKNPKLLKYHLQNMGNHSNDPTIKKYTSHTIDWVKGEILKKEYQSILVLSDKVFYDELGEGGHTWTSTIYGDIEQEYYLENLDLHIYDVIIVGGKDVKTNYIYIIKHLKRNN